MRRDLIISVIVFLLSTAAADAQVPGNCGMQLGGPVIFCETFDNKNPGIPSRTGDLDPNVWGVSRLFGNMNLGQGLYNAMPPVHIRKCDGTTPSVIPPNDIVICNGQLREATNDNLYGSFEAGQVSVLAMYPKQPFDFAGRTGTISFDVSNDTHGTHAAWPEFWLTDLPVPAPFIHGSGIGHPVPQNGFGLRFHAQSVAGQGCVNNTDNVNRWTVGSAVVIRNYVIDDQEAGGLIAVTPLDCVTAPPDNSGITNHIEIKVSQNQIDIYATDAGTTAPLKHIAVIRNANLTLTRGLVWIEDVHYNADKGELQFASQREHTFVWDNVAFDGPFTYRDFSYDALDALVLLPGSGAVAGSVNLGKKSDANQSTSWNVLNMPASPQAAAVRVLFNFYHYDAPVTLNVTVNGHAHPTPWPYPENWGFTSRTFAVTIPITDLVPGTNVVQLGGDQAIVTSNVNIVLVTVPGGVPVLPGSNNAYPAGGPVAINGVCGSANGTIISVAPTTNLCAAGIASPVSGTGPWLWTCAGSNGGITATCQANKTVVTQPKKCTVTISPFTFPQGQPPTTFSATVTANCQ